MSAPSVVPLQRARVRFLLGMTKRQIAANVAPIQRATKSEALNADQLAMYQEMSLAMLHLSNIAIEIRDAEQSHGLDVLTQSCESIRAAVGRGLYALYESVAESQRPKFDHVQKKRRALIDELCGMVSRP